MVITRRWDHPIKTLADVSLGTPTDVIVEKNDDYEVHYLPHIPNLRDLIYTRYGDQCFTLFRRLLTLIELFLQNFFSSFTPYNNFLSYTLNLVKQDKDICAAIISGNPFHQFNIGYQLKLKFGMPWIADYRDAWTTSEINFINRNPLFKFINYFDRRNEKKWVGSASYITASSGPIAAGINNLTGVRAEPIFNGFVVEDFEGINPPKFQSFTITYVGTLYHGQKVEIFCEAFKKLIDNNPGINCKLLFPGLALNKEQTDRVNKVMKGYESFVECTPRMERTKVLGIEKSSHLLFHVAWDEQDGIIASKIYEYIASGTFIIVTPTDNGSIEEIVNRSECGVCTKGVQDTYDFLVQEYGQYMKEIVHVNDTKRECVKQYSREGQAKKMAGILNELMS